MLQSSNVLHSKDDLWYETVQNRLLIYSTHINCVESIVQAELLLLSSNESINLSLVCQQTSRPCIDNILEMLYKFRTHSLLDIGFNYAYCQQFIALRILFEHFPRSVGLYRLVIASNLSETIDPNLYFKEIFSLPLNSFNQLDSVDDIQNCDDQNVNRIQCNFSVPLRLSWESLNNPLELVQIISRWLVERSMQIDCRSGLTNYALNLLSLGSTICEELIREKKVNEEVEKCLKSLRKVRRDFIELVQIIYSEHISPSTILNISNNIPNLIVQQFNDGIQTFQLNMKHFQHFNSKSILNYLLQLHLNLINSNTSYDTLSSVSSDHHLVAYVIYQLLPHLAEKCIPTDYDELIKYCLLCSANYIGLTGHIKLLETIKLRSFSNLCDNLPVNINELISGATNLDNNDYINILNPYRLLSGLLYVLIEYKPNYKSDSFLQHESTISFTTYLNDATCLINAMLIYAQDSITLQNTNNIEEYKKLIKDIQLVSRFTSVLTELQSLVKSIENVYDTGYFCNMLNSWIQIFTRLTIVYEYELTDEIIDNTIRRKRIPETFVKELSDWLHQLHSSLSKGFKGYPSEVWLNTGLQYALFASGNEYFLELSRDFCLNFNEYDVVNLEAITSNLCDSSDRLEKWGICLLNATRSEVIDWLHQLHSSLSKGFKGYPSEVWLNTGLQYALFASGNEYFLELSRDFCLNFNEYDVVNLEAITSNLCDSSDRLEKWGICLLNATRSYVNTSMPRRINLQFIFSYSLSNEIEDSNEYMARYCLNIIHTSSYIHQYWSESLQLKFQLEEYLLNSCVFINTLNSLLPLNKRLSNISPYKLRYLWSNNNNNNNNI
ncbi:unnamed protein product [Heterobilharzia americana]|nr:unnamed protein product [Heterobilharzia americana]